MNHIISRIPGLFLLLFLVYAMPACKKDPGNSEEPASPVVSARGEPTAPVFEKTIGAAGGTITSADGFITITVPAGTVANNTTFGIQTITNTLYTGQGESNKTAYRLTPEGTTFSKPVEVTCTYTPQQMQGMMPELITAAFQTAEGTWKAIPGRLNKATNQYSFKTTHFSDWSIEGLLSLSVPDRTVAPGEKTAILLRGLQIIQGKDDELLAPLGPHVTDIEWSVIQRGKGTLKVNEHNARVAEFTANAVQHQTSNNFAEIAVKITGIDIKILDETLPDKYNSFKEVTLITSIEIMGNSYVKGTFMGVPVEMTVVQATGGGSIGFSAVKDGLTIALTVSAEAKGEYPCGSLLESGKGQAVVSKAAGIHTKTYYSFYIDCNSKFLYSEGNVVIKSWGNAGEIVEGSYKGKVYITEESTPEGCPIYKSHILDVEFRTVRLH